MENKNVLRGTFAGWQRYLEKKRRIWRWQWEALKGNLTLQRKMDRLNRMGHVDYAYCSLWPVEDKDYILEEYKRIRLGEDTPNQITRKIDRFYNDQTVYYEKGYKRFEPQECTKTIDIITDEYLTYLTQRNVGRAGTIMQYISQGTGTDTPDSTDTALTTEVLRRHILDNGGYIDFLGHSELYGLIFTFSQSTIDCSESGLHNTNSASTDIMMCRNKYNPVLAHVVNVNAISINLVINHRAF